MLKLEVSWKGLLFLLLAVAGIWLVTEIWPVLLLIIVAGILMTALLPYVNMLIRRRLPRVGAVLVVIFAVLLVLGGLVSVVVPAMLEEADQVRDDLPQDAQELEDFIQDLGFQHVELSERVEEIDWDELISGRVALDYGQRVVFGLLSAITVLVLTAYLLIDAPRIKHYIYRFVPDDREPEADRILGQLSRVVGGYVRGQIITSVIIGVFTTLVLAILGVPNALAFGVVAAFADVIPLVGAFIAIIPATLGAFSESPVKAVIVLGLLLLYQQFEDRYLVPRVYGSMLGLPPLVVLVAVLVGGELLGIPGILLALPATAAAKVFLDFFLDQRDPSNALAPKPAAEVLAPDPPVEPEPVAKPRRRGRGARSGG